MSPLECLIRNKAYLPCIVRDRDREMDAIGTVMEQVVISGQLTPGTMLSIRDDMLNDHFSFLL